LPPSTAGARLAALPIPIIGRIEGGRVLLDLRCLEDEGRLPRPAPVLRADSRDPAPRAISITADGAGASADRVMPIACRRSSPCPTIDLGFAYTTLPGRYGDRVS